MSLSSSPADSPSQGQAHARIRLRTISVWTPGSTGTLTKQVRFLQKPDRRSPPTPRPATTRRTPSAPPSCCDAMGLQAPSATRCRRTWCTPPGLQSVTNLVVRRRLRRWPDRLRSTPMAMWCRRAMAGRTTPTAARWWTASIYGRAAAVSKCDFRDLHVCRARALRRSRLPAQGRGGTALHL